MLLRERIAEAIDAPERRAQIMRDGVGESLLLCVSVRQFSRTRRHQGLAVADRLGHFLVGLAQAGESWKSGRRGNCRP